MSSEDRFRLDETARRAGVPSEEVERLAGLGVLARDEEGMFSLGDVRRVRIVHACDEAGMPAEAIGRAITEGTLSLAFLDLPTFRWAERTSTTYRQLASAHGLSVEHLLDAHEALGVLRPGADDMALDEDLELIPVLVAARAAQVPDEAAIRTLRVYTESLRRVASAETDIYHDYIETPLLRAGVPQQEVLGSASEIGSGLVRSLDAVVMAVYRRQQEHTWLEDLVEHIEGALDEAGVRARGGQPPAMCFLDLTGFTELTEREGDEAAARLASTLAAVVQRVSRRHGGRPVKRLGDGVMFYFKDPRSAVVAALDMVDVVPQAGLPPAHVGVDAGPVIAQDGDFFGRTVNVAARLADRAGAGEVLVTDDVVERGADAGLRFETRGSVELKGIGRPLRIHAASRS